MESLSQHLPEIIAAAAQSQLGILALLSVALSILAYFFFARASEKIKVGIFIMLFVGVVGFAVAMFRSADTTDGAASAYNAASLPGAVVADSQAPLSTRAALLLEQAATDPSGYVFFLHFGEGVELQANGQNLIPDQERRTIAAWESALQELTSRGLMMQRDERGEVFAVTNEGYEFHERRAAP